MWVPEEETGEPGEGAGGRGRRPGAPGVRYNDPTLPGPLGQALTEVNLWDETAVSKQSKIW